MKNKIKILFTIPNFNTAGSGKEMFKIAEKLDKGAFDVHICCQHDKGEFFKVVKASGLPVHVHRFLSPMKSRLKGLLQTWEVSRFFSSHNFDIIHSFNYSDDYSEALAARLSGTKWIYTKKNMSWGNNAWYLRSKLASGIVVRNTDMINDFFKPFPKARLIAGGVDVEEFKPMGDAQALQEEFNILPTEKILISVANLVPVKGIEILIEAFDVLFQSDPTYRLFIVGDHDNAYGSELQKQVREKNLRKNITFTGKRHDVANFLQVANVFVLPTLNKGRQEGFPVATLEAMAAGIYVLASDVAGVRDQFSLITNQLFTPGDHLQLAEKIKEVFDLDDDEYKKLVENQLQIIRDYYTIGQEVINHQDYYQKVLSK